MSFLLERGTLRTTYSPYFSLCCLGEQPKGNLISDVAGKHSKYCSWSNKDIFSTLHFSFESKEEKWTWVTWLGLEWDWNHKFDDLHSTKLKKTCNSTWTLTRMTCDFACTWTFLLENTWYLSKAEDVKVCCLKSVPQISYFSSFLNQLRLTPLIHNSHQPSACRFSIWWVKLRRLLATLVGKTRGH